MKLREFALMAVFVLLAVITGWLAAIYFADGRNILGILAIGSTAGFAYMTFETYRRAKNSSGRNRGSANL